MINYYCNTILKSLATTLTTSIEIENLLKYLMEKP